MCNSIFHYFLSCALYFVILVWQMNGIQCVRNGFLASWACERGEKWGYHTLKGAWVRMSRVLLVPWISFSLSCHRSNRFPHQPSLLPVCMRLARPGSLDAQSFIYRLRFCFLLVVSHSLSSYKVSFGVGNKMLLPCLADEWHSVCEKLNVFLNERVIIPKFRHFHG